jgi:hypothetical protein
MAKIVLSALLTDISGKSGGTVFSKNKGGAYLKNRVVPSNPQTAKQISVRSRISALSQAWKSLTSEQQSAWQAATPSFQYVNNVGQLRSYTAQALFMALNSSIRAANPSASLLTSPPAPAAITNVVPSGLTALVDTGLLDEFAVTFAPTVPAGHAVLVQATRGLSPGITRPSQSFFRQIGVVAAATTTPYNGQAAYLAEFGSPSIGQKVFVKFVTVLLATGQRVEGGMVETIVESV